MVNDEQIRMTVLRAPRLLSRKTLPATTYTAAITAEYTDGWFGSARTGTSEFTGLNAGAWTLNGFQAKVAYMPFQTGIGQVIYIANRSSQAMRAAEHKRSQAGIVLKVSEKAFGPGRMIPITRK